MKHFLVVLITLCLLLSSAYTDLCKADYYPDSVWGSAQLLVSVLDLELKLFERDWNEKIRNRSDPLFEKNYPIMTKTKPEIHINHSSFNDEIRLTAFVDNPSLFLSLTRDDRKVLVKEIVTIISGRMYFEGANIWDGLEYVEGKRKLSEYIIVSVLIGRPNVPPYLLMSNNIIGQAGYENRKYVFSVPYYLDLKNTDGKWVRSDDHPMKGLKRSMLKLILGCWLIGMELHLV